MHVKSYIIVEHAKLIFIPKKTLDYSFVMLYEYSLSFCIGVVSAYIGCRVTGKVENN